MNDILRRTEHLLSETDASRLKPSVAEVAMVGRSNVGKSSLINGLCQRRALAVVSQTPGRTRAIHVFSVGHFRWLVDLPGYGFAKGSESSRQRWGEMIEGYLGSRPALKSVLLLIDSKVGPTELDFQMREWLIAKNLPYMIVGNKIDQVKPSLRIAQQKKIAQLLDLPMDEISWVSVTDGIGMEGLRKKITNLLEL